MYTVHLINPIRNLTARVLLLLLVLAALATKAAAQGVPVPESQPSPLTNQWTAYAVIGPGSGPVQSYRTNWPVANTPLFVGDFDSIMYTGYVMANQTIFLLQGNFITHGTTENGTTNQLADSMNLVGAGKGNTVIQLGDSSDVGYGLNSTKRVVLSGGGYNGQRNPINTANTLSIQNLTINCNGSGSVSNAIQAIELNGSGCMVTN